MLKGFTYINYINYLIEIDVNLNKINCNKLKLLLDDKITSYSFFTFSFFQFNFCSIIKALYKNMSWIGDEWMWYDD